MKTHLLIWKLLVPPVLGLLVFFLSVGPERLENFKRDRTFSSQLSNVQFAENESGVLILGNSLLQHALPPDRVMTSRFNAAVLSQQASKAGSKLTKLPFQASPHTS